MATAHSLQETGCHVSKKKPQIVTALSARELLGFIWAIAVQTEAKFPTDRKAA